MGKVVSITRMSSADAVSVNQKIQVTVADGVSTFGEQTVGAPVIDSARELDTATSALEQTETASFELRREVDTSSDRCIGAIIVIGENVITSYESAAVPLTEPQQQELGSAHWLMNRCFPYGRGFLQGRWSEQFGVTELILKTAALPEAAPHIQRLGLVNQFDLLKKLHMLYGERMGFTALKPGDTESPLYKWHEALESYLGAVIYTQKNNPELKAKLIAPYETTAKAVRNAGKRPQKDPQPQAPVVKN
jgi:hypothetical protein